MSKKKTKQPASDKVQVTVLDPRRELPSQVRYMSADRLAGIIELAQNGDTRELFALYRDVITNDNQVRSEFMKRKIAVLGDPVSVVPFQKKEQDDVDASAFCSDVLDNPTFADAQSWLMNATLYPVAVVEKVFEASSTWTRTAIPSRPRTRSRPSATSSTAATSCPRPTIGAARCGRSSSGGCCARWTASGGATPSNASACRS